MRRNKGWSVRSANMLSKKAKLEGDCGEENWRVYLLVRL